MDVLSEKERAEKENRELVEKLNEENAKLTAELEKTKELALNREGEGMIYSLFVFEID